MAKIIATILLVILGLSPVLSTRSAKRGLIYIPNQKYPVDDSTWIKYSSELTWYYNYQSKPTVSLYSSSVQYVPMLWGVPASNAQGEFYNTVKALIDVGQNISFVLGFNEPDESNSKGGSNIPPKTAASAWINEMEPLRRLRVKLGAPAVTGSPSGLSWLQDFFRYCNGQCHTDFIPIHWYGNFEGLANFTGQVRERYRNVSDFWVTEFAETKSSLQDTQAFYNQSVDYLDRLNSISRYSYFGSFRSDSSNIGPNVAILTSAGKLTDIGSWYIGGNATGNIPSAATPVRPQYSIFTIFLLAIINTWLATG